MIFSRYPCIYVRDQMEIKKYETGKKKRTILCVNQLTSKTKVLSFDNSLTHEIRLVVDMKILNIRGPCQ